MDRYQDYSLDELLMMPLEEDVFDQILAILEQQCSELLNRRATAGVLSAE